MYFNMRLSVPEPIPGAALNSLIHRPALERDIIIRERSFTIEMGFCIMSQRYFFHGSVFIMPTGTGAIKFLTNVLGELRWERGRHKIGSRIRRAWK